MLAPGAALPVMVLDIADDPFEGEEIVRRGSQRGVGELEGFFRPVEDPVKGFFRDIAYRVGEGKIKLFGQRFQLPEDQ